jgi:hypothetical protein
MTHEDILKRMNKANPLSNIEMITDGQLAELTVQIEQERRTTADLSERAGVAQREPADRAAADRRRPRWLRPAVAFVSALLLVLVVFGLVALLRPGQPDVIDQQPPIPTTTQVGPPPPPVAPEQAPSRSTAGFLLIRNITRRLTCSQI